MCIRKERRIKKRYLPLDDIKQINVAFLDELENLKKRLGYVKDEAVIKEFHEVLLTAYTTAIELRMREREVDYEIKCAEINERRRELKPWRRCWLWRLLLKPLTNRAQDVIEARAEVDADYLHTKAETAIEYDRKELSAAVEAKKRLEEIISRADCAEVNEVLNEEQAQESPAAEAVREQLQIMAVRKARPPRSCRRPPTQSQ